MMKKAKPPPVAQLVFCSNHDFYHGERGRGEMYVAYMFIPHYSLCWSLCADGYHWALRYAPGWCSVLEDIEFDFLAHVLHTEVPELKYAEKDIWITCVHCKAMGVRGGKFDVPSDEAIGMKYLTWPRGEPLSVQLDFFPQV